MSHPGKPRVVVIVEDDAKQRQLMELILSGEDYEVHSAADGRQGVDLARKVLRKHRFVNAGARVLATFAAAVALLAPAVEAAASRVCLITTGGTIAHAAPGRLSADDLLRTLPGGGPAGPAPQPISRVRKVSSECRSKFAQTPVVPASTRTERR